MTTARAVPTSGATALVTEAADILADEMTPPAAWYHDPELYALERIRIFGRAWQMVALTTELETSGAYTVVRADEREFVLVRDVGGQLRGFHNVCRHRAARLVQGAGSTRLLQCHYHGWTYRLDGALHRAPGLDRVPGFDPNQCRLAEVPVAVWEPFVFLNPDPDAGSLMVQLGPVVERVAALGMDLQSVARDRNFLTDERVLACNWKVAIENSLECYHCPTVHPSLADTVDLARREFELLPRAVVGRTPLRTDREIGRGMAAEVWAAALTQGFPFHQFHWLFPNQSLSIWPGPGNSFTLNRWQPLGPEQTRWWIGRWWPASVSREVREQQWAFVLEVAGQDVAVLEGVQQGVRSGAWRSGPYSLLDTPRSERPLLAFNRMVSAWLGAAVADVDAPSLG
jgi:choline monooxygenase